jgi:hypothetical protein
MGTTRAPTSRSRTRRNVDTTTDYDEIGRPIHIRSTGKELAPEEWFAYDANGRRARDKRQSHHRSNINPAVHE